MFFKKWFGKKEQEVVEEAPVERKSVDELVETMDGLSKQLMLVLEDAKKQDEKIKQLENELRAQYEATCVAKEQIIDLLNENNELEQRLAQINDLSKNE